MASLISLSLTGCSSRYFSKMASSTSANLSMRTLLQNSASSLNSGLISLYSYFAPKVSSSQTISFIVMRSITPSNSDSTPMGYCMGRGRAPNFFSMDSMDLK